MSSESWVREVTSGRDLVALCHIDSTLRTHAHSGLVIISVVVLGMITSGSEKDRRLLVDWSLPANGLQRYQYDASEGSCSKPPEPMSRGSRSLRRILFVVLAQ